MPDTTIDPTLGNQQLGSPRRKFLLLFPIGVFSVMTGAIAAAAFRFLRPMVSPYGETPWTDVAPIQKLQNDKPIMQKIAIQRRAGWAVTAEEAVIYVRPDKQALSSVCPHENCDVAWMDDTKQFLCPCHDSKFSPDGKRISGPSMRDMDVLPSRTQNGILQVQYVSFANNTPDRLMRG